MDEVITLIENQVFKCDEGMDYFIELITVHKDSAELCDKSRLALKTLSEHKHNCEKAIKILKRSNT
jgi:hypothetical protein